ncbi:hypothetical protein ERO13_A02G017501v2 [Gossypium hirsutum]|nr:hypothetical protein ERO13_A02G017501v2 [Gossypium hirsutum]
MVTESEMAGGWPCAVSSGGRSMPLPFWCKGGKGVDLVAWMSSGEVPTDMARSGANRELKVLVF